MAIKLIFFNNQELSLDKSFKEPGVSMVIRNYMQKYFSSV